MNSRETEVQQLRKRRLVMHRKQSKNQTQTRTQLGCQQTGERIVQCMELESREPSGRADSQQCSDGGVQRPPDWLLQRAQNIPNTVKMQDIRWKQILRSILLLFFVGDIPITLYDTPRTSIFLIVAAVFSAFLLISHSKPGLTLEVCGNVKCPKKQAFSLLFLLLCFWKQSFSSVGVL